MEWVGHVERIGEMRNAYKILVGKWEGMGPLGRPKCKWECSMKMDIGEIESKVVDWVQLA
jgi:hypothetical protein